MLIQRFSLRALFVLMTLVSVIFLMLPYALRGSPGPAALLIVCFFLMVTFLHYALAFSIIWLMARIFGRSRVTPQSPFASDVPPKQIIPPTS